MLDPALLRPGRFDRQIVISNPDFIGREKILRVHVRKVPLGPDVDLKVVARGTPGFSGADLMNLVNEAALLAARRGKRVVTRQEFEDSRDKIMMGAERRTLIMTEDEKRLTAFHEAGHALVSVSMPASTPIHKATIIPRGRALGMVQSLPERDQISQSYEQLIAMLAMSMGGRVAEELIFGKDKVTSGAAGDIQQVTKIARAMVTRLGFSDKLGTVMYGENQDEVFLGYSLGRQQNISEATAETIDQEVRRLVQEAHDTATRVLTERRADLETLGVGAHGVRDADRRRDRGAVAGRAAGARIGDRPGAAGGSARRRSFDRQGASDRPGARRPRAAAADLEQPFSGTLRPPRAGGFSRQFRSYRVGCCREGIGSMAEVADGAIKASWPGLSRPSTKAQRIYAGKREKPCDRPPSCRSRRDGNSFLRRPGVDGRDKPGHDGKGSTNR